MFNILVVEDERVIARLLKETLEVEGYQVVTVLNGEDAVQFALRETPHLIILDLVLPGMDGYEVACRLRNHHKTMHIPIIALSSFSELADKVHAFEIGVDDYITKPFQIDELIARIRTQIRRVQQNYLSPLIGLPGGLQVELAIEQKLQGEEPWSILYLDLDNFKAFNDVYGFLTGNDIIRLVGRICQRVVRDFGNADDFVGHIGGDDFVVVTTPDRANILCKLISTAYKEESAVFYRPEDLRRGSISGINRKGRTYQFPLVSLSIGVVNNQARRSHSLEEVSYLAAEAKYFAKQSTSNVFHISPQRDTTGQEVTYTAHSAYPMYTARQNTDALVSPSFPQFSNTSSQQHTGADLLSVAETKSRAEYQRQVY
ncbi:MAG TPA: response regulator [Ktedonobacteraceae bacterium]|nr:response regulator [Ktedonobacteraceae bacterium]